MGDALNIAKLQDAEVGGKTVLVRVDYNVPVKDGVVIDDSRIKATEETVKYLLEKGCKVVLIAHFGRPKGQVVEKYSLKPVVPYVKEIMGVPVHFGADCIGPEAKKAIDEAKHGEAVLLENLRFHPEEEANDDNFAKQLAEHGELFVQEAFGAVHRAHASTVAITKYLPSYAGFLVQREVEFLSKALIDPQRPYVAVIGGAKVSDKLSILNNLVEKVNVLLIGGAMAYTFLKTQNVNLGKSLVELDKVEEAKAIVAKAYARNVQILLPADHVVASELSDDAQPEETQAMAIPEDKMGLDIGPRTIAIFKDQILKGRTIFWNGPVGVFENRKFARGSITIAETLVEATKNGATTIVGGGDSLNVLKSAKISKSALSHASTGGGASMEFLEGKNLPGLSALVKKITRR